MSGLSYYITILAIMYVKTNDLANRCYQEAPNSWPAQNYIIIVKLDVLVINILPNFVCLVQIYFYFD